MEKSGGNLQELDKTVSLQSYLNGRISFWSIVRFSCSGEDFPKGAGFPSFLDHQVHSILRHHLSFPRLSPLHLEEGNYAIN